MSTRRFVLELTWRALAILAFVGVLTLLTSCSSCREEGCNPAGSILNVDFREGLLEVGPPPPIPQVPKVPEPEAVP